MIKRIGLAISAFAVMVGFMVPAGAAGASQVSQNQGTTQVNTLAQGQGCFLGCFQSQGAWLGSNVTSLQSVSVAQLGTLGTLIFI